MRVLIVEHEARMVEQLRKGLEQEGYSALVVHDGQSALDIARTTDHDLMILDWMLPGLDGREVARKASPGGNQDADSDADRARRTARRRRCNDERPIDSRFYRSILAPMPDGAASS